MLITSHLMSAMVVFITVVWTRIVKILLAVTHANARLAILEMDILVSTLTSVTFPIEINLASPYTSAVRVPSASTQLVPICVNVD